MHVFALVFLMTLSPVDAVTTIDTANLLAIDSGSIGTISGSSGGYDAIKNTGRRPVGPTRITREDNLLRTGRRTRLTATTQDLVRNFSLAGWMIRRHLDYVALFDFHSRLATDRGMRDHYDVEQLKQVDDSIEKLMKHDSRPSRCDIAGRFHREKMFRLAEMRRTVDGDVGLLKLADGRLQGIEGDLVRNPGDRDLRDDRFRGNGTPTEWVAGVRTGTAGRSLAFAVHRRGRGGAGYDLNRIVSANNLIHYGHFIRFASDQTRGVSPIVAALNNLRDVYTGFDLALAKMKVSQLFAFAVYSQANDSIGEVGVDEEGDENDDKKYNVDFGSGPVHLELDGADRAEFLESKTPSTEMQAFTQLVTAVALKALDIPYSFYDESHTNFFGQYRASQDAVERDEIPGRQTPGVYYAVAI